MMINNQMIRIGRINYTNVWPIFHYFPERKFEGRAELIKQVPAGLNRAMAAGEVDMGPISSFSYGEHAKEYLLLPDLSVSAWGPVQSILLFHRKPLEEIKNGRIALVNTSATSVNLLKIIVEKFHGGKPEYFSSPPDVDQMLREADAALLIGDDAIRASWREDEDWLVTDLGVEWNRLTNHWMTFAVWAIREDSMARHPDLVTELYQSFVESKEKGLSDPASMIHQAVTEIGGTEAYWQGYFDQLAYDFAKPQWEGLQLYFDYAYELGLLQEPATIRIWKDDKTVLQVTE